jgi:flagellar biosynthesis protein FlhG
MRDAWQRKWWGYSTMHDQADHLRRLIRGVRSAPAGDTTPRSIVVAGAKGGVGTTTIAVNLAVAMARNGQSTVLVDGDLGKADAAALCGLHKGPTIVDVLAGRHGTAEAFQVGPSGLQVLAGAWATGHLTDCNAPAQERLIAELTALTLVDAIVIDAGCGLDRVMERFWRSADQVLLVTTPDDTAVMDAYAVVKTMAGGQRALPVHAVVNLATRSDEARNAYSRLAQACRRFLAIDLPGMAHIMMSPEVAAAGRRGTPFLLSAPVCQPAQTLEHLAQFFNSFTSNRSASFDVPLSSAPARATEFSRGRQPADSKSNQTKQPRIGEGERSDNP